MSRSSLLTTER